MIDTGEFLETKGRESGSPISQIRENDCEGGPVVVPTSFRVRRRKDREMEREGYTDRKRGTWLDPDLHSDISEESMSEKRSEKRLEQSLKKKLGKKLERKLERSRKQARRGSEKRIGKRSQKWSENTLEKFRHNFEKRIKRLKKGAHVNLDRTELNM